MQDDLVEVKTIFLQTRDEDTLMVLRDFFEPLGYRVEFSEELKNKETVVDALKGAASALAFLILSNIDCGCELLSQSGAA